MSKTAVKSSFYRFQVHHFYTQDTNEKPKSVGEAYAHEGQLIMTLKLWTFTNEKFYIVAHKFDPTKYFVMTRVLNTSVNPKSKYRWNIVGSGSTEDVHGYIRIDFDIFSKPIYVSTYPENTSPENTSQSKIS